MKRINILVSSALFLSGFGVTASQGIDWFANNVDPYFPKTTQVESVVKTVGGGIAIYDAHRTSSQQNKLLREQRELVRAQTAAVRNIPTPVVNYQPVPVVKHKAAPVVKHKPASAIPNKKK